MVLSSRSVGRLAAGMLGTVLAASASAAAAEAAVTTAVPAPLESVRVFDTPNDPGRSITLEWSAPADTPPGSVVAIVRADPVQRAAEVTRAPVEAGRFLDSGTEDGLAPPDDGVAYTYIFRIVDPLGAVSAPTTAGPVESAGQWFHRDRANILIILAVFATFLTINIVRSRRGKTFFIRRLPPVDAIEEAIGRATEMGRPVLYVPGIEDVEDIQTIASMLILEKVAERTATYDVPLLVPTRKPFVMAVADEVVKTGCAAAGRPDAYQPGSVRYVSDEQFAYCAGVNGIILRERPAANLYLGRFFAESLIFAETGFAAGSIQIAGTAEVTQLPFFIAACDYTLIGEEFFAAGAYMSQDPTMLSTLRAADWAKVVLVACLLVGACLVSFGIPGFREWFAVQ